MSRQSVLITGGYGCIGAETAKWLLNHSDSDVVICSRSVSATRSDRVFHDADRSRMTFVKADICDQQLLQQTLIDHKISRVVHMAALQTPDCNANRNLGLQINLAGTQNLIEAMKASSVPIDRFIFASSIAVYGPRAAYPPGPVPMLANPQPVNVYGVWKLAGEIISQLFWEETKIPSLCLRPGVLFGPGRDAGLTSSPTTAIKCVALGRPYKIPFRSRQDYQYAPDVGAAFGRAVMDSFEGYGVFTLPSHTLQTQEVVAALRQAAHELDLVNQFEISVGQEEVPFICDLEYRAFTEAFPGVRQTNLNLAVKESLVVFLDQVRRGWLTEYGLLLNGSA